MPLQILEASETTGLAAIQSSTNMPAGYLSFPVELLIMVRHCISKHYHLITLTAYSNRFVQKPTRKLCYN